jgi:hypothetical protein
MDNIENKIMLCLLPIDPTFKYIQTHIYRIHVHVLDTICHNYEWWLNSALKQVHESMYQLHRSEIWKWDIYDIV